MTDETAAPSGGEAITVVTADSGTPAELTMNHAAKALADIRFKRDQEPAAESADEATADNELSGEDNAGHPQDVPGETQEADPAEVPPIEPPRSWTKEAKDRWNTIPREAQEEFARIEQGREREFLRSQQDAAEKLKGLTAKEQQVEHARQQYEAQLPVLMQTLQDAQQSAFSDIRTVDDVTKLANEDPFRYLQWQAHQTKLQAVNAELERANGEKSKAQQTEWTNHVQAENAKAAELIPDLADETKATALHKRAADRLSELGFKPEELNDLASGKQKLSIYDHRIQQLIFSDLKLSDIQKAKTAVAAKPLPPVQRPGTSKPPGSGVSERVQSLDSKLTNSGRLNDAVAALVARRASQRRAS